MNLSEKRIAEDMHIPVWRINDIIVTAGTEKLPDGTVIKPVKSAPMTGNCSTKWPLNCI